MFDSLSIVLRVNLRCDAGSLLTQARSAPRPPDVPSSLHTITYTYAPHSRTHNFHPTVPWIGRECILQLFHPLRMADGVQGYTPGIGVDFDKQGRRKRPAEMIREFREQSGNIDLRRRDRSGDVWTTKHHRHLDNPWSVLSRSRGRIKDATKDP